MPTATCQFIVPVAIFYKSMISMQWKITCRTIINLPVIDRNAKRLSPETKQETQGRCSFKLTRNQIVKHNNYYLKGVAQVQSIFCETQIGKLVATDKLGRHKSVVHETTIELNDFYNFLK